MPRAIPNPPKGLVTALVAECYDRRRYGRNNVCDEIRVPTVIVDVNYAKVLKKRPLCVRAIRERDGKRLIVHRSVAAPK